eukprot:6710006-Pyramimonas_sp.AAC.2
MTKRRRVIETALAEVALSITTLVEVWPATAVLRRWQRVAQSAPAPTGPAHWRAPLEPVAVSTAPSSNRSVCAQLFHLLAPRSF